MIFNGIQVASDRFLIARGSNDPLLNTVSPTQPNISLYLRVNGVWEKKVDQVPQPTSPGFGVMYTREMLGLADTDVVDMIRLDYGAAPMGIFRHNAVRYLFTVEPGFRGEVVNEVRFYGIDEHGVDFEWHNADRSNWYGNRGAYIIDEPTNIPVVRSNIRLQTAGAGNIIDPNLTQNNVIATYSNQTGATVTEPYAFILLPSGMTLDTSRNPVFTDRFRQTNNDIENQLTVIDSDFNNRGQQLIRVDWSDDVIGNGQDLSVSVPVTVSRNIANMTEMFMFLYSTNTTLGVADVVGDDITNSVLDTNSDDMNQSGNLSQSRVVSGNRYIHSLPNNVTTQMFVKGDQDTDYSLFGYTKPGGLIDYKLMVSTTSETAISNMIIYNVLPSVGDLGITDNQARNTMWQPVLTGPVVLPSEWLGIVDVFYSESKNPSRDDLVQNVDYTDPTTVQITDPVGAENPNWQTESQVTDWSTINSYKLVLRNGHTLPNGTVSTVSYTMQAPTDVDPSLLDGTIPASSRAAFNSFAVARDRLQVVEPLIVGVALVEDPTIVKDVNGEENIVLDNRNDMFTWNLTTSFGNRTDNWSRVIIVDEVHPFLDIKEVRVVDQDGNDVTATEILTTDNNIVRFEILPIDGSFAHLAGQTYTMQIDSVVNQDVTDEQLAPYILAGGIPNEGRLEFGNDGDLILSNVPTVVPPMTPDIDIPIDPEPELPQVPEVEKDINGQDTFTLANRNDMFTWNVTTSFGNTTAEWTQAIIVDQVHPFLDIDAYRLVDLDGNDISHLGQFVINGNTVSFVFETQYDSFAYLANTTLVMQIDTFINADLTEEDLMPYILSGGIPNEGRLEFGNEGDMIYSNRPTVVPPLTPDIDIPIDPEPELPQAPEIEKDVNGKDLFVLENRDDMFTWNLTTSFGNTTAEWTQASIVDQVHSYLDIVNYRLVDLSGNDMSHLGKFVVDGNTIRFEFATQYDSFAYLTNMTLVMQIDTVINAKITDEQLKPYILTGGIPNQGSLEFGNEGDLIYSNRPTVVPPTKIDNEIPIEPVLPGDLPNTANVTDALIVTLVSVFLSISLVYVSRKIRN